MMYVVNVSAVMMVQVEASSLDDAETVALDYIRDVMDADGCLLQINGEALGVMSIPEEREKGEV
jgi:hypothetical protein